MEETFGNLDPRAPEFIPATQTQLLPQPIYNGYPPPSSSFYPPTPPFSFYPPTVIGIPEIPIMSSYTRPMWVPPPSPPPPTVFRPLPMPTRALLLTLVPRQITETMIRYQLGVFGEVRSVQMERLQEGIVIVHFYDLRDARAALVEIQKLHFQHQGRLRQYSIALQNHRINLSLGFDNVAPPLPPRVFGVLAGHVIWAQFTVPQISSLPDGHNQGSLVVFNLNQEISSSELGEIFEVSGPVMEVRETAKRNPRFVEFFDIRDADHALSVMNGKEIHGNKVAIEFSRPVTHDRNRPIHPRTPPLLPPRLLGGLNSQHFCEERKFVSWEIGSSSREGNGNGHCNNLSATTMQSTSKFRRGRPENSNYDIFLIKEEALIESSIKDMRTTVMIKNIPNKYSKKLLLDMLDNHCKHCNEQIADGDGQPLSSYDFVYLPIDYGNKCNTGFGFVNFTSPQAVLRFYNAYHMKPWEVFNSKKICEIAYARIQGLEESRENFKNAPFANMVEEYSSAVFIPPRDGKQLTAPSRP